MMWLLTFLAAVTAVQWINLCFALLCLALAAGADARAVALAVAVLHLGLVWL